MFNLPEKLKQKNVNQFLVSTVNLGDMAMGERVFETMVLTKDFMDVFCHRTECEHEALRVQEMQEIVTKYFR